MNNKRNRLRIPLSNKVRRALKSAVEPLESRRMLAAHLVSELTPGSLGASIQQLVTTGQLGYFVASDKPSAASEYLLYRTDAATAGTFPLATFSSEPRNLRPSGGLLYYESPGPVRQLWRSDGNPAGTVPLTSFASPAAITRSYTDVDGQLFFVGSALSGGAFTAELWTSGGTAATTSPVVDPSTFESIANLTSVNGTLYFAAAPKSGIQDVELWKTDGTAAGTTRVKDIRLGAGGSSPAHLTNVNGTLYFVADDGTTGPSLWKSDGTEAGTVLVKTMTPSGHPHAPQHLKAVGGTLFFTAVGTQTHKLYKSDGTPQGTVAVADVGTSNGPSPSNFTSFAGSLYFATTTPDSGRELWRSDGTTSGTLRVTDINPGSGSSNPGSLVVLDDALYFSAFNPASGFELWKTDGTAAGTILVNDINPGAASAAPTGLVALTAPTPPGPDKLLFVADDGTRGTELWATDGTSAGTTLVKDIVTTPAGSAITMVTPLGNRFFFNGPSGLWVSDGSVAGTLFLGPSPIDSTGFVSVSGVNVEERYKGLPTTTAIGDILYFRSNGRLWRSDGTPVGTYQVSSAANNLSCLTRVGNLLFFSAEDGVSGHELWRSDGTATGTYRVADLNPGPNSSLPRNITGVNGFAYFTAWGGLWRSDGTAAGTYAIGSNAGTPYGDTLYQFQAFGDRVFYTTTVDVWTSDGTTDGTVNLTSGKGLRIGQFSKVQKLGNSYYFLANPAGGGAPYLWKTDGTPAGTLPVKSIGTSPDQRFEPGYALTVVGSRLYFIGPGASTLWTSDGTESGTLVIRSAAPDALAALTPVGDRLYFSSAGALWVTDGTPAGTVAVENTPPPALSAVTNLRALDGSALVFSGQHPAHGTELWIDDSPAPVPATPTNFSAAAVSAAQIDLSWTDASVGESGFRLERSRDPDFATVESSVLLPPDRNRYADRPLAPGTTYYYRLSAVSRSGQSPPASASAATTGSPTPAPPDALAADLVSDSLVHLSWTDRASNETGYVLQRSTDPSFANLDLNVTLPPGATSYDDTSTTPLGRYHYRVYATAPSGNSDYASLPVIVPDRAPTNVLAMGVSPNRIDVQWTNNANTATAFRIERSANGGAFTNVGAVHWTRTTFIDTSVKPVTTYTYRVVATTAGGPSRSATSSTTTAAPVLTTPVKSLPPVINHAAASVPSRVVTSGGLGYFVVENTQLWLTDGTGAGTRFIRTFDRIRDLTDVGGTLFFVAAEHGVNSGIYKTDGTPAGTSLVKDINPQGNAFLHDLVAYKGKLYFRGVPRQTDSDSLWSSDGTPDGTVEVKRFGWRNGGDVYRKMIVANDKLFLGANDPGEDHLPILYVSDGTTEGTVQVVPGAGDAEGQGPSDIDRLFAAGPHVYMGAIGPRSAGWRWWRTDGTAAGTIVLADAPGLFDGILTGVAAAVGSTFYTRGYRDGVGWELFKSDAAGNSFSLVSDLAPGNASSFPAALTPLGNEMLFFASGPGETTLTLYDTAGTPQTTRAVRQFTITAGSAVPDTIVAHGAAYFFVRDPIASWTLYRTDGTDQGTVPLKTFPGAAQPGRFSMLGNMITFAADDGVNGVELWRTDGTAQGTVLVKDISFVALPTKPDSMVNFKDAVYFTYTPVDGGGGSIYRTDGTAQGTSLVYEGQATGLLPAGDRLYFTAYTPQNGTEIWASDGTAQGTHLAVDVVPGASSSNPILLGWTSGKLFFTLPAGPSSVLRDLWVSDGTAQGTRMVRAQVLLLGTFERPKVPPIVHDGVLYFTGDSPSLGTELWRSDGTAQGTYQLADIYTGPGGSGPWGYTAFKGALYFNALHPTAGWSTLRTDLASGTTALLFPGDAASQFTPVGDLMYFSGGGPQGGELWVTDGSPAGHRLVKDLVPGPLSSSPHRFTRVGNLMYFLADGALWKTDGSADGTLRVRSWDADSQYAAQQYFVGVGDILFFSDGRFLWRSDGTPTGTHQVMQIADSSNQQRGMGFTGALAAALGDLFLFGAQTTGGGRELRAAHAKAPEAPSGLAVTPVPPAPAPGDGNSPVPGGTPTGVRVTWTDNSDTESGFILEKSLTPDFSAIVESFFVPADVTSFTDPTASIGDPYFYRVRAVNAGGASKPSNQVTTGAPRILSADFAYEGPDQKLILRFAANVAASLSVADLRLRNLTTGADVSPDQILLTYDPSDNTVTVTFVGRLLDDGRYRLTLRSSEVGGDTGLALDGDGDGAAGGDFTLDFFALRGDANRDGKVDFGDLVVVAQNYNGSQKTYAQGDFNGDGKVDFADLVTVSQRYNTSLPPAPAPPAAAAASAAERPVFAHGRVSARQVFNADVPVRRPNVKPTMRRI